MRQNTGQPAPGPLQEADFIEALVQGDIILFCQPMVNGITGAICEFEVGV